MSGACKGFFESLLLTICQQRRKPPNPGVAFAKLVPSRGIFEHGTLQP